MSKLIDGYTQIVSALEDWLHVLQKEMETDPSPNTALLFHNLSILLLAHQVAIPQVKELEQILQALGLKPRSTDTSSLDALWREDTPL